MLLFPYAPPPHPTGRATHPRARFGALLVALLCACGETPNTPAQTTDAGVSDAGVSDAGVSDAGVSDAGVSDAGLSDAGVSDAGVSDAGVSDAGVSDAGVSDAGLSDAGVSDAGVSCGVCGTYTASTNAGTLGETALTELSGLASSRVHPRVLYAHNDSGDTARFYALRETGEALGRFNLTGVTAVDWEDIAVGPCPHGSCVYLGDIGDNAASRTDVIVYRTPEPAANTLSAGLTTSVTFERFPYAYPDGAHDAEALLVHPSTGEMYILTKESFLVGQTRVYRFPMPLQPDTRATLVHVADVPLPRGLIRVVTAAAIHPCAPRVLLRTYDRVFELRGTPGAPFESVFGATAVDAPVPSETQGEAIEYRADGRGFFTASEGVGAVLHTSTCQ